MAASRLQSSGHHPSESCAPSASDRPERLPEDRWRPPARWQATRPDRAQSARPELRAAPASEALRLARGDLPAVGWRPAPYLRSAPPPPGESRSRAQASSRSCRSKTSDPPYTCPAIIRPESLRLLIEINETLPHPPRRPSKLVNQLSLHQQSFRDRQPKRVDGSHVDNEIKPCGELHRKAADLGAAKDASDITSAVPKLLRQVGAIRHQPAIHSIEADGEDRRHAALGQQRDCHGALSTEEPAIRQHDEPAAIPRRRLDDPRDLGAAADGGAGNRHAQATFHLVCGLKI